MYIFIYGKTFLKIELRIQNNNLIQTDRVESRGKLKLTTRQASVIYLYIK